MHELWVGTALVGGWFLAWWLDRGGRGTAVARLLFAAVAVLAFAYFLVRGEEPRFANLFFFVLAVGLLIRETARMRRGRWRRVQS